MTSESEKVLRNYLDELESAVNQCAFSQMEGPIAYEKDPEDLADIETAKQNILSLFMNRQIHIP